MMLRCGGEQFRVGFTGAGATQVNDGGSKTVLPLLHAGLDTGHGFWVNIDGRPILSNQGGGDTATQMRFAR
jgi:hypothetical protein